MGSEGGEDVPPTRGLRMERKGSWHGRSESSDCLPDVVSSDIAPSGGAGGLTRSLSLPDRWSPRASTGRWKLLDRIFDLLPHRRKMEVIHLGGRQPGARSPYLEKATPTATATKPKEKKKKKKKRRSSWLPDPARRWPIQGW